MQSNVIIHLYYRTQLEKDELLIKFNHSPYAIHSAPYEFYGSNNTTITIQSIISFGSWNIPRLVISLFKKRRPLMIDVRISDKDYFGEKTIVSTYVEAIKLINSNPNKFIRVDGPKSFRVLLKPEINHFREVDGMSSLAKLYEYFNDVKNHGLAAIQIGSNGNNRIYINQETYKNGCGCM
jgi:hypothetical protein